MLRVKLAYTRREASHFDVPLSVCQIEKRHWSAATMRRRRQGDDKKVCDMCVVFRGRMTLQTVSNLRCVLVAVAACDANVYGPRREARIICKHICTYCAASVSLVRYFNVTWR